MASIAMATLLVVLAGLYLAISQAPAQLKLHRDFAQRAALAAHLTSADLLANVTPNLA